VGLDIEKVIFNSQNKNKLVSLANKSYTNFIIILLIMLITILPFCLYLKIVSLNKYIKKLESNNQILIKNVIKARKELLELEPYDVGNQKAVALGVNYQKFSGINCGYKISAYNYTKKFIEKSESFQPEIQLFLMEYLETIQISFTRPTKDKSELKNSAFINVTNKNLFQIPIYLNDTGIYFWEGKAVLLNKQTNRQMNYYFTDSFYVY
jgi:hypothetical protein